MKSILYGIGILLIVVIGGLFIFQSPNQEVTGNVVADSGETQEVILGMKNYNYHPNTITVKAGIPVKIYLDNSVYGCFRDFTIRDFRIHKYLETPNDYVEFTPSKKGTYTFACSMNMGVGKLIVT